MTYLFWNERALAFVPSKAPVSTPTVVDSWLVADGRILAFELHQVRFSSSCALFAPGFPLSKHLWEQVRLIVPTFGNWFPRIELHLVGLLPQIYLQIRSAPPLLDTASLWVSDLPDQRHFPRIKGPDLPFLHSLKVRANRAGADDALILDDSGFICESSTANIFWWDERGSLCLPHPSLPQLFGVTRAVILQWACANNVSVCFVFVGPRDVFGEEVFITSSLHHIRKVTAWVT